MHIRIIFIYIFFVSTLILSPSIAFSSGPAIGENTILLNNGTKIFFHPKKIFFDNPENALKKGLPVYLTSTPKIIPKWEVICIVKENHYYEGIYTELEFFSYDGKRLSPTMGEYITPHFLINANRIFLQSMREASNYYTETLISYLLDSQGKLITAISHKPSFKVDFSN